MKLQGSTLGFLTLEKLPSLYEKAGVSQWRGSYSRVIERSQTRSRIMLISWRAGFMKKSMTIPPQKSTSISPQMPMES